MAQKRYSAYATKFKRSKPKQIVASANGLIFALLPDSCAVIESPRIEPPLGLIGQSTAFYKHRLRWPQ
jgi:hypothetical protein